MGYTKILQNFMSASRTSNSALNTDCQKILSFKQDQNMCERVAVGFLHQSQTGLILGMNFASLTLEQWTALN